MIYLFLAMICSSSIALTFKYSENNDLNRYAVTSTNYIVASTISLIMAIRQGIDIKIYGFGSFVKEFISNEGGLLSQQGSLYWAVIIGMIGGVFFFLSFLYYQISVRESGAGMAGAFGKLGIFVPVVLSFIFWKQDLKYIQLIGLILACVSIVIASISKDDMDTKLIKYPLVLLFIFGGLAEFANKIYQKYGILEYKNHFLFFVFFTAFIVSIIFTLIKNKNVVKADIIVGTIVGIPNLFSSFFLINALDKIKASIAFPIYSAGSIVIISILSVIIFNEKFNKKDIIALSLTMISLILVNIA